MLIALLVRDRRYLPAIHQELTRPITRSFRDRHDAMIIVPIDRLALGQDRNNLAVRRDRHRVFDGLIEFK